MTAERRAAGEATDPERLVAQPRAQEISVGDSEAPPEVQSHRVHEPARSAPGPVGRAPRARLRWLPVVAVVLLAAASACTGSDDPGPGGSDAAGGGDPAVTSAADPPPAPELCAPLAEAPAPNAPSSPDGNGADSANATDPTARAEETGEPLPGTFADLIPVPRHVEAGTGRFVVDADLAVTVADPAAIDAACVLREELARVTGVVVPVTTDEPSAGDGSRIVFAAPGADDPSPDAPTGAHHAEGYRLTVAGDRIEVDAAQAAGHGWAVQTLLQSAAPAIRSPFLADAPLSFPAGTVEDWPRYEWRGLMVDVARHYFGPTEIRRVIDLMAAYKLNVLHLHLTDDQGWRIEIDAYPALTEVGGASEVGGGPGGHLTKDDYRALVDHAARRGITVVPEIDMPGHTNAALVAVPELTCDGVAPEPYTGTSVGFSSLCIGKDEVRTFVRTVLTELAEMTPGPYLHVGGDEANATDPDDYRAFVAETAAVVRDLGKIPVGWEEVGPVTPGGEIVVQHWLDRDQAADAARSGADVVLSPSPHLYFDMAYGPFAPAGNRWAGQIDTRKAYDWDPGAYLPDVAPEQILGVEAPLWTELIDTPDDIDLRLLPRLPALAELAWSAQSDRAWDPFRQRLAPHAERWAAAGRPHTADPAIPWD